MKFLEPEEYQPLARSIYGTIAPEIKKILPFSRIEHIGSSAVEGLISKGDLDIYIEVPKAEINESEGMLRKKLGFKQKKDTLQNEELRMLVSDQFDIDVALQLVAKDSDYVFFLKFKELLQSNEGLRKKYNQLKRSCTNTSHTDYRKIKSEFIRRSLKEG